MNARLGTGMNMQGGSNGTPARLSSGKSQIGNEREPPPKSSVPHSMNQLEAILESVAEIYLMPTSPSGLPIRGTATGPADEACGACQAIRTC
jgi:hypothetical protein